ncbi:MAG TPA: DUF4439 domain-containing protein [Oryzihumus sp.]|nr:DUF4439 domain-containing protein [Oryzihumus sp.]
MPGRDRMPRAWSRRSVLVALGVACASALTGCGVRLEDHARSLPFGPEREPAPDERTLLAALADTRSLEQAATAAGAAAGPWPARLAPAHHQQAAVLEQVLRQAGVPVPAAIPTVSSSPGTSTPATATTAPGQGRAGLAAQELVAVQTPALITLAGVGAQHVTLLAALAAHHGAAATLLGGSAQWPEPSAPTGTPAARLLAANRSAAYGFEVVQAQGDHATAALAAMTLTQLRHRETELVTLAGDAATPPALGYPLPFPVTTPTSARRLARRLVAGLLSALAAELRAAAGNEQALTGLVRWSAETAVLGTRWGSPLPVFPGLSAP